MSGLENILMAITPPDGGLAATAHLTYCEIKIPSPKRFVLFG